MLPNTAVRVYKFQLVVGEWRITGFEFQDPFGRRSRSSEA
jgi:hypothetical protein